MPCWERLSLTLPPEKTADRSGRRRSCVFGETREEERHEREAGSRDDEEMWALRQAGFV